MSESKDATIKEAQAAYGIVTADLSVPIILERDGKPVAVVLSFEEYQRLQSLEDEERSRQAAWTRLDRLLADIHSRPTELTPEQIEAEITLARAEVKEMRRAHRGGH